VTARRGVRTPVAVFALAGVGSLVLVAPLAGLVLRAPWGDLSGSLAGPEALAALRLSLVTSSVTTALAVLLGVPLAWVLARVPFPGRAALRAVVTLPIVLPPVVGGVALLAAFGRRGWLGGAVEATSGVTLPFSTAGVVLAQLFVAMPFLVVTVEGALGAQDRRSEDAAEALGAGPWRTFRAVTLPATAPVVAAGAALTWARALGEFGATVTFAGSLRGTTRTAPLAVYQLLETDRDAAVALSLVLVAVSLAVLVALRGRWFPGLLRR
jgi:molybdate transport system permease protein